MTDNIRTLLETVREALDAYLAADGDGETAAPAKKTRAKSTRSKAKAEPEEDPEDADGDEGEEDVEAELRKMTVAALRKRAIAQGFDKDDVKDADKDDLVEAILDDIAEVEGKATADADEDEDADSDSEEESEDDERRAELEGMTLAALKKLAREEPTSAKPNEIRTMDKEALVDLILDAEGDDDSDSAMDGDEAEEDGYTKDELQAMDAAELKTIIEEWGIDMPAKKVKPALIKAILDAQ